jgi:hypothetical protein
MIDKSFVNDRRHNFNSIMGHRGNDLGTLIKLFVKVIPLVLELELRCRLIRASTTRDILSSSIELLNIASLLFFRSILLSGVSLSKSVAAFHRSKKKGKKKKRRART